MAQVEESRVDKVIQLIETAGLKLGLPSNTMARAMIIYHHFRRCVHLVEYDDGLSAAAALCLSIKVNEETTDVQSVVIVFWSILRPNEPLPKLNSEELKNLQLSVSRMQFIFCRVLRFSLNHELAHQYLVQFLRSLYRVPEFRARWDAFVNIVWKVVSSAYQSKRCLEHTASQIAVTSIYIASKFCMVQVDRFKNWQKGLCETMDDNQLMKIVPDILEICHMPSNLFAAEDSVLLSDMD